MENTMYNANLSDYKIKQDEMLRQAENFRLAQVALKANSPSNGALRSLKLAINQLFSN
jgi:hypothetical protein